MNAQSRRLAALEAEAGTDPASAERDREFLQWLAEPSVRSVAVHFARVRAERRWCRDHDVVIVTETNGVRSYHHGWYPRTTEDERDALTIAELDRLIDDYEGEPLFDALARWCDDDDGLAEHWSAYDAAAFRIQLRRDRAKMDVHRTGDNKYGREWRRRHPEWRPGMEDEEYDAWELTQLAAMMQERNQP